ncbi:hypothetical protein [Sphingobium psychrophilum]|uniref:hypothetical protein n=1 Tax=Sphingobium psychrophilum TaxID=2728834 RepID=UPI00146DB09D|nr:hypothetical protein [Sphingobium psychrophilum]
MMAASSRMVAKRDIAKAGRRQAEGEADPEDVLHENSPARRRRGRRQDRLRDVT